MSPHRFRLHLGSLVTAALVLAFGALSTQTAYAADALAIRALSARAEAVSGGDVLIQVTLPANVQPAGVSVTLDGVDVGSTLRPTADGHALVGLVSGLKEGRSTLRARAPGGRAAGLVVINHPLQGPVFSGPRQTPFVCETAANRLEGTPDSNCVVPTKVEYQYRTTTGQFKPYPTNGPRPADLAQTTALQGGSVDYIVRVETGVIDRGVYQIALLHSPGQPAPDPWTETPGWNRRLIYTFGQGCGPAYRQGRNTAGVVNDLFLSKGYAVASSTFNVFANNCNELVAAEVVSMVKEHFIEAFGVPAYTIGWGASGGAMQQHLIAQNYPGLLDGLLPQLSWSDVYSLVPVMTDCSLILHATRGPSWTDQKRGAAAGFNSWENCLQGQGQPADGKPGAFTWINATFSPGLVVAGVQPAKPFGPGTPRCDPVVPVAQIYDPRTNPKGVRCSVYDNSVNAIGKDPKTGFARRPFDNVGVQYGLAAFNAGRISADEFIELNQGIGGYDDDGVIVAARSTADPAALRVAYAAGRVNSGGGDMGQVPIIDFRVYREPFPDVHDRVRSFATRQRLQSANGHSGNQLIIVYDEKTPGGPAAVSAQMLRAMDQWLANIAADTKAGDRYTRVVRNKPTDLTDGCYTADGRRISETASITEGECAKLYPVHLDPRLVAGAPLAGDVLKCQLKPVTPADYRQPLTTLQLASLKTAFPTGVCDFSKPGVGSRKLAGTWFDYPRPGEPVALGSR